MGPVLAEPLIRCYWSNDDVRKHVIVVRGVRNVRLVSGKIEQSYGKILVTCGDTVIKQRNVNKLDAIFEVMERIGRFGRIEMNKVEAASADKRVIHSLHSRPTGDPISNRNWLIRRRIGTDAHRDYRIRIRFPATGA